MDIAVINGNYAIEAGLSVNKDALAKEDAESMAATTYGNIVAVKEGKENDPAIQALVKALQSDKVKTYIEETYDGGVLPQMCIRDRRRNGWAWAISSWPPSCWWATRRYPTSVPRPGARRMCFGNSEQKRGKPVEKDG